MSNAENTKTMDSRNSVNAEDKNGMIRGMLKDASILFAITLIAGLILSAVYQLTKEPCTYCQTNFGYDYYIQPTSPKSTYFKKGRFDDESECA